MVTQGLYSRRHVQLYKSLDKALREGLWDTSRSLDKVLLSSEFVNYKAIPQDEGGCRDFRRRGPSPNQKPTNLKATRRAEDSALRESPRKASLG